MSTHRQRPPRDPYDEDRQRGGSGNMSGRVYGTDANGQEVTAAFGKPGTKHEGHTFLAAGHNPDPNFWSGGHNHYGPGDGPNDNEMDRGFYNS